MSDLDEGKDGLDCRGVIFQFNSEAVLFEFTLDGQEEVGMVKPSHLKVRGKVIPSSVKKIDTLSKYIEVGDEVKCHVVKKEGLKTFKYTEEDDDGKATEMEIQPNWMSNEAVKLDGNEGDGTENKKDDASAEEPANKREGNEKGKDKEKNDAMLMPPPPPNIRSIKPKTGLKSNKGDESESEENDNKKNEALEKKSDENQKESSIADDDVLQLEVQLGSEFDEFKDEDLNMDGMEVLDELPEGDDDVEEITIIDDTKDEKKRSRSESQDKISPKKRSKDDSNGQTRAKTPPPPKMNLPKPVKAKASSKSKETPKLPTPVRAQASSKETPKLPTPVRAQAPRKVSSPPPETPTVEAKVLQLKKPTNSKLHGRVFCGIMEIEDGEHTGDYRPSVSLHRKIPEKSKSKPIRIGRKTTGDQSKSKPIIIGRKKPGDQSKKSSSNLSNNNLKSLMINKENRIPVPRLVNSAKVSEKASDCVAAPKTLLTSLDDFSPSPVVRREPQEGLVIGYFSPDVDPPTSRVDLEARQLPESVPPPLARTSTPIDGVQPKSPKPPLGSDRPINKNAANRKDLRGEKSKIDVSKKVSPIKNVEENNKSVKNTVRQKGRKEPEVDASMLEGETPARFVNMKQGAKRNKLKDKLDTHEEKVDEEQNDDNVFDDEPPKKKSSPENNPINKPYRSLITSDSDEDSWFGKLLPRVAKPTTDSTKARSDDENGTSVDTGTKSNLNKWVPLLRNKEIYICKIVEKKKFYLCQFCDFQCTNFMQVTEHVKKCPPVKSYGELFQAARGQQEISPKKSRFGRKLKKNTSLTKTSWVAEARSQLQSDQEVGYDYFEGEFSCDPNPALVKLYKERETK